MAFRAKLKSASSKWQKSSKNGINIDIWRLKAIMGGQCIATSSHSYWHTELHFLKLSSLSYVLIFSLFDIFWGIQPDP
jgi:hypothetical protein